MVPDGGFDPARPRRRGVKVGSKSELQRMVASLSRTPPGAAPAADPPLDDPAPSVRAEVARPETALSPAEPTGRPDPREQEDWFLRMSPAARERMRETWRWEAAAPEREAAYQRSCARTDMQHGAILVTALLFLLAVSRFTLFPIPWGWFVGPSLGAAAGWLLWRVDGGVATATLLGGTIWLLLCLSLGADLVALLYGTLGSSALWAAHGRQRESRWATEGRPIDANDPGRRWQREFRGPTGPGDESQGPD